MAVEAVLTKDKFKKLATELCKESGETQPPSKSDLDKAFTDADVDRSNNVSFSEFLDLYAKVKKGEVKGLGGSTSSFSFGRSKKPKPAAAAAAETDELLAQEPTESS